jgi:RimJ/RimL family protein N-acetyltransferase
VSRLIYGGQSELLDWANARIPHATFSIELSTAIGVADREGAIAAVWVFYEFSTGGCFVHIASNGNPLSWLGRNPREILTPIAAYPFIQCKFRRASCAIAAPNRRALALAERVGFRREGLIREGGPEGEDLVLLGMLRRECPWLPA